MATDLKARKNEDDQLVRNLLSSIDMSEKQILKTVRLGRKNDKKPTNNPWFPSTTNKMLSH